MIPTTKRLSDVMTEVKRAFGDESGVQLTDSDLIRWTNAGQVDIVTKNKILKALAQTDIVAGTAQYAFPSVSVIEVESIHVDGSPIPALSFVEAEEYILKYDSDRSDSGTPRIWYPYAGQIFLWPKPDSNITNGLSLFYTPMPTAVVASGDLLGIPDKYFNTLINYVLYKAFEMDENFDASSLKMQEMMGNLQEFADEEAKVFNRTYDRITIVEDGF